MPFLTLLFRLGPGATVYTFLLGDLW